MTGFKFKVLDFALITGAVLAVILSGFSAFAIDCEQVPDSVLRLHILANSDSEADQQLKYRLRDHILLTYGEQFAQCDSREQAIATAKQYQSEMEQEAQRFILSEGYNYKVSCEVGEEHFTTRNYETCTLPAGDYTAVRFLIGDAEGKNWWCVMFPPLCLPAAGEVYTPQQSKNIEESRDFQIKFALFELLEGWFGGNDEDNSSDENPAEDSALSDNSAGQSSDTESELAGIDTTPDNSQSENTAEDSVFSDNPAGQSSDTQSELVGIDETPDNSQSENTTENTAEDSTFSKNFAGQSSDTEITPTGIDETPDNSQSENTAEDSALSENNSGQSSDAESSPAGYDNATDNTNITPPPLLSPQNSENSPLFSNTGIFPHPALQLSALLFP